MGSMTISQSESRLAAWFRRFDIEKLKPLLIYKYSHEKHRRQKEYNQMMLNRGEELEKQYVRDGSIHGSVGRASHNSGKISGKMRYFGSSDNLHSRLGSEFNWHKKNEQQKRASVIKEEQELKDLQLDNNNGGAAYSLLRNQ
jgi:hypothetical protein